MRKTLFTLVVAMLAFIVPAFGQTIEPTFSTADNEAWYFIQFSTGNAVLADQGNATNLKTATKSGVDAQKWKLVGNASSFEIVGKSGRKITYAGSKFQTSSTATSYKFKLLSNGSKWELQSASGNTQCMNQWGGAGAGKELGMYTAGDVNNILLFQTAEAALPIFSNATTSQYYFITFLRTGYAWTDGGDGNKVTSQNVVPKNETEWRFVGNAEGFTIENKANRKLVYDATTQRYITSSTLEGTQFVLVQSASTYAPCWEVKRKDNQENKCLNAFGGTELGTEIGEWDTNDVGNAVSFTDPAQYKYADYKVKGIASYTPENKATLWYTQPAKTKGVGNPWMEYALPLGNGQFGAMVFGDILEEEVQFNEKTLWNGSSSSYGIYQNFGNLFIKTTDDVFGQADENAVQDYVRQLDLTNATASVSYKSPDKSVTYTREYIASNPDKVIAIRLKASEAGKINVKVSLQGGPENKPVTTYTADGATFKGKLTTVSYQANLKLQPVGGTMTQEADGINVKGADELLIVLAGATDFDPISTTYVSNTTALATTVQGRANDAIAKGWNNLYADHVADFKSLFDRASVELDGMENTINTEDLVKYYNTHSTPDNNTRMLEMLYFNLGRYMVISASRGVESPSNLQGIWANTNSSPWHSDIHSNINVEENYWPTEPTNLSECHLPFLKYIYNMSTVQPQWSNYAKNIAKQTKGWTLFTENNIFGGKSDFMLNYVIANAWYCSHLWQHYRYTLDKDYLKSYGLPPMISCTDFWMERLVKAEDGTWECPKEYSPEHGPGSSNATAHSQQLVWDLFTNTIKGVETLGIKDANVTQEWLDAVKEKLSKLDTGLHTEKLTKGTHNGITNGTDILKEWKYYDSNSVGDLFGHRHQSHLMCLYPCNQITKNSPYFKPAVASLTLRGDNSTGWSMGWRVNLWARALNGDHAHTIYHNALKHSTTYGTNEAAGGIYYNLFDSHAPFQIDGNFASCAAVAELLLQSYSDTIQLLPAVPSAWPSGKAKGLKAIGNFTIDQTWKNGKLLRADILSNKGTECVLNYANIRTAKVTKDGTPVDVTIINDEVIKFPTEEGASYVVDISGIGTGVSIATTNKDIRIKANGRKVTISGNAKKVMVLDLEGRNIMTTKATSFAVPQNVGKMCIIKAIADNGAETIEKISLK